MVRLESRGDVSRAWSLLSPVVAMLGVIWALSIFGRNHELVAIRTTGVSVGRLVVAAVPVLERGMPDRVRRSRAHARSTASNVAFAHTTRIAYICEDDGDVTLLAASYHGPAIRGGIIDGRCPGAAGCHYRSAPRKSGLPAGSVPSRALRNAW